MTRSEPAALFRRVIQMLQSSDPAAATLLPELEHHPGHAAGWLALGEFLHGAGRHEAASVALARALKAQNQAGAEHTSGIAAHRLGQCLAALGKRDAAIAAFRLAVRTDPDFAEAWYSLALALQDAQDHHSAIPAYRMALAARPDFPEAAFNLAVSLQEQGRLDDAMDAYALALHLRSASFGRIAQALVSGRAGVLWLDTDALRAHLVGRGAGLPAGLPG